MNLNGIRSWAQLVEMNEQTHQQKQNETPAERLKKDQLLLAEHGEQGLIARKMHNAIARLRASGDISPDEDLGKIELIMGQIKEGTEAYVVYQDIIDILYKAKELNQAYPSVAQFDQDLNEGNREGISTDSIVERMANYRVLKDAVKNGLIKPEKVVGSGGNKTDAINWLDSRIAYCEKFVVHGGLYDLNNAKKYLKSITALILDGKDEDYISDEELKNKRDQQKADLRKKEEQEERERKTEKEGRKFSFGIVVPAKSMLKRSFIIPSKRIDILNKVAEPDSAESAYDILSKIIMVGNGEIKANNLSHKKQNELDGLIGNGHQWVGLTGEPKNGFTQVDFYLSVEPIKSLSMVNEGIQMNDTINYQTIIAIAADSVGQLRKQDVERVMNAANEIDGGKQYESFKSYLINERPDLKDEIEDLHQELTADKINRFGHLTSELFSELLSRKEQNAESIKLLKEYKEYLTKHAETAFTNGWGSMLKRDEAGELVFKSKFWLNTLDNAIASGVSIEKTVESQPDKLVDARDAAVDAIFDRMISAHGWKKNENGSLQKTFYVESRKGNLNPEGEFLVFAKRNQNFISIEHGFETTTAEMISNYPTAMEIQNVAKNVDAKASSIAGIPTIDWRFTEPVKALHAEVEESNGKKTIFINNGQVKHDIGSLDLSKITLNDQYKAELPFMLILRHPDDDNIMLCIARADQSYSMIPTNIINASFLTSWFSAAQKVIDSKGLKDTSIYDVIPNRRVERIRNLNSTGITYRLYYSPMFHNKETDEKLFLGEDVGTRIISESMNDLDEWEKALVGGKCAINQDRDFIRKDKDTLSVSRNYISFIKDQDETYHASAENGRFTITANSLFELNLKMDENDIDWPVKKNSVFDQLNSPNMENEYIAELSYENIFQLQSRAKQRNVEVNKTDSKIEIIGKLFKMEYPNSDKNPLMIIDPLNYKNHMEELKKEKALQENAYIQGIESAKIGRVIPRFINKSTDTAYWLENYNGQMRVQSASLRYYRNNVFEIEKKQNIFDWHDVKSVEELDQIKAAVISNQKTSSQDQIGENTLSSIEGNKMVYPASVEEALELLKEDRHVTIYANTEYECEIWLAEAAGGYVIKTRETNVPMTVTKGSPVLPWSKGEALENLEQTLEAWGDWIKKSAEESHGESITPEKTIERVEPVNTVIPAADVGSDKDEPIVERSGNSQAENQINGFDREMIAQRYAHLLGAEARDMHYNVADSILGKDAYAIEHIANGLNKHLKALFTEVTGIKLPATQSGTWEMVLEWAGISPEQDQLRSARKKVNHEYKLLSKAVGNADQVKEFADKVISEFNVIKKEGREFHLVNEATNQGYNLSKKGMAVSRPYLESRIALYLAEKALNEKEHGMAEDINIVPAPIEMPAQVTDAVSQPADTFDMNKVAYKDRKGILHYYEGGVIDDQNAFIGFVVEHGAESKWWYYGRSLEERSYTALMHAKDLEGAKLEARLKGLAPDFGPEEHFGFFDELPECLPHEFYQLRERIGEHPMLLKHGEENTGLKLRISRIKKEGYASSSDCILHLYKDGKRLGWYGDINGNDAEAAINSLIHSSEWHEEVAVKNAITVPQSHSLTQYLRAATDQYQYCAHPYFKGSLVIQSMDTNQYTIMDAEGTIHELDATNHSRMEQLLSEISGKGEVNWVELGENSEFSLTNKCIAYRQSMAMGE